MSITNQLVCLSIPHHPPSRHVHAPDPRDATITDAEITRYMHWSRVHRSSSSSAVITPDEAKMARGWCDTMQRVAASQPSSRFTSFLSVAVDCSGAIKSPVCSSLAGCDVTSHLSRASRSSARTRSLLDLMRQSQWRTGCIESVCGLIDDDEEDALLDMSMIAMGTTAFFYVLSMCIAAALHDGDDVETVHAKRSVHRLIRSSIMPRVPQLLRSFDASIVDPHTGNNALHELMHHFAPACSTVSWLPPMMHELVRHGVRLEGRNNQYRTVALCCASRMQLDSSSAPLRLLLQLGSDINAQDYAGDTILHFLIRRHAFQAVRDIYADGRAIHELEYFHVGSGGRTITDLAASQCMDNKNDDECEEMYRWLESQRQMARDRRFDALCEPLIPDLASLVLQYLDDSTSCASLSSPTWASLVLQYLDEFPRSK